MRKKTLRNIFIVIYLSQFTVSIISPFTSSSWFYSSTDEYISTKISANGNYLIAGKKKENKREKSKVYKYKIHKHQSKS